MVEYMKNIILVVVLVGLASIVLLWREADDTGKMSELFGSYFGDELMLQGIEDIGHPIEGFDADLLMIAFPGLLPVDFHGVSAFEGKYQFKDGELSFIRNSSNPISSAERTVSSEGYQVLLENVGNRLNRVIQNEYDVRMLIDAVNIAERVEARIGISGEALGVSITPLSVLEDSRCPIDALCVQAGTVRLNVRIENSRGADEMEIQLRGEGVNTEAEKITLLQVQPDPATDRVLEDSDYLFVFEIRKR
mgnify:CR=1 FL=1